MNRAASIWMQRLVATVPQKLWLQPQYGMNCLQRRTITTRLSQVPTLRSQPPLTTTTATRSLFFSKKPTADKKEDLERKQEEEDRELKEKKYSIYDHVTGYFQSRSKKENAAKMKAQIDLMATTEAWTLEHFEKTLDDQLKTWGAKLSWYSGNKDLKLAKQAQLVVKSIIELVGKNATSETIENMGRKDKLKISYQSGATVEDINTLFMQFQTTSLMHKVIRNRKANGQPLPHDADSLKIAMSQDGRSLLTRTQLTAWKNRSYGNVRSMLRSKRAPK